MKRYLCLLLAISSSAMADQVTTVRRGGGPTEIPYCGGKIEVACDPVENALETDHCYMQLTRSRCMSVGLYVSSSFYPGVGTVEDTNSSTMSKKIYLEYARLAGDEKPYTYVFLHNTDNTSYAKLKLNL